MAGLQAHPIPSREVMREALNIRHGEDLQNKISAARVAVCGLGGLGSNIAIALARAGVGHLHLIDFDRVDLTNLNRQQYAVGQLGQYKTDALRETLSLVSPYCDVTCDTIQVTEEICRTYSKPRTISAKRSTGLRPRPCWSPGS